MKAVSRYKLITSAVVGVRPITDGRRLTGVYSSSDWPLVRQSNCFPPTTSATDITTANTHVKAP